MKIVVEMELPEDKVAVLTNEAVKQKKTVGEILAELLDFLDAYEDEGLVEVLEKMREEN